MASEARRPAPIGTFQPARAAFVGFNDRLGRAFRFSLASGKAFPGRDELTGLALWVSEDDAVAVLHSGSAA